LSTPVIDIPDNLAARRATLLERQAEVLEMIVQDRPLADVLATLCRIAEDYAGLRSHAAILLVDDVARVLRTGAAPSLPEHYNRAVDGVPVDATLGTCARAAATGEVVVTPSIDAAPGWAELKHLPGALDLRAAWSMPILSSSGTVLGTFGTYFHECREPSARERELVSVLSRTAALAIERRRTDEALRERERALLDSERLHRAIFEANPECVKLVDARGIVRSMNAAGVAVLGFGAEAEVLGRDVLDLIAPEYREAFRALNESVCAGSEGTLAYEILVADGTRRSVETRAVPLRLADQSTVHLGVTRDVTERVRSERALARSRARLDYAVRLSGIGFWYCDLPFDELAWDASVRQHFFVGPDERVTIDTFYDRIHPDDRDATRAAIDAATRDGTPYDVVYRTVNPASAQVKWIRALGGTTFDADGRAVRFDGVTVDVTAQRLDQLRLANLLEELRDHDRRKDEFLATLAHELRNPLAPIRTGLDVLDRAPAEQHAARMRAVMRRQLSHLVRMVDDLLDVSRITRGKVNVRRERIDLREAVASAIEATRPVIDAAGHRLEYRPPDMPIHVSGDATRLAQVVSNLLNNAAKYTPDGGVVTLAVGSRDDDAVVSVTDNGIGIAPDMLPRVFDMFTQVGPTLDRAQGGLGIGLTLVQRLVLLHDGTVTARSPGTGQGSTFTVRLPLAD
jgi:PAS domain S-box-containing protein